MMHILASLLHPKPEPNMLKILPSILSNNSQKLTHYPYFILTLLRIYYSHIILLH